MKPFHQAGNCINTRTLAGKQISLVCWGWGGIMTTPPGCTVSLSLALSLSLSEHLLSYMIFHVKSFWREHHILLASLDERLTNPASPSCHPQDPNKAAGGVRRPPGHRRGGARRWRVCAPLPAWETVRVRCRASASEPPLGGRTLMVTSIVFVLALHHHCRLLKGFTDLQYTTAPTLFFFLQVTDKSVGTCWRPQDLLFSWKEKMSEWLI